jgi:hypothetical protein
MFRASLSGAIVIGTVLFYGCATVKKKPVASVQSFDINRPPVEAPSSLKASDFRLNPPVVEDFTVKKLTEDKELVAVRFAADKRLRKTVTINPGGEPIVLHDDGLNGDEKAGDHVYSAILPSEWDSLAAQQDRLLAELKQKNAPLTVPVFHGREVVAETPIYADEVSGDHASGIVKAFPFGAGALLVNANESLFVTDPSVVQDPTRTFDPCTGMGATMGKWTFGYLMTAMANTPVTGVDPSDFVMNWLKTWEVPQTVNGFTVPPRLIMIQTIIDMWPKLADGRLDLTKAPLKLSAIVNRIDLAANPAYGQAGGAEGRFIFTLMSNGGGGDNDCALPHNLFTVILEYGVPIANCHGLQSWAQQWLNLQNFTLGSPQYNAALEAITEQFAAANANPSRFNGSALDQLRTDQFSDTSEDESNWELREFNILTNHQLNDVTVKQTPDTSTFIEGGPKNNDMVQWINQNRATVAINIDTVPDSLPSPGGPFLGGSAPNAGANDLGTVFWNATANTTPISTEGARHQFSLNTCNGCHGGETATNFRHVLENNANVNGGAASLSDFLTGKNMPVTVPLTLGTALPSPGTQTIPPNSSDPKYTYGDLLRRAQILYEDANSTCLSIIRSPVILTTH